MFEGVRGVIAGRAVPGSALALAVGLSAGYALLACWIFARVHRSAVRTGLIARYSAETVS